MPRRPRKDAVTPMRTLAFGAVVESFLRHKRAANCSEATTRAYTQQFAGFTRWCEANEVDLADVATISRETLEVHLRDLLDAGQKPNSVKMRHGTLSMLFRWLVAEETLAKSPMARVPAPFVPDEPPAVLSDEELRALLKACEGKTFTDRRDMAMMSLLFDTGVRRSEMASMRMSELDWKRQVITVRGKQRLEEGRLVPFGRKSGRDLDRYLLARLGHRDATSDTLWLGRRGPMTDEGVYLTLIKRARMAGIEHFWPHRGRHTFAHLWLMADGQEGALMQLAGWKSDTMMRKYGRSAAGERAREAHKRLSPRDRL